MDFAITYIYIFISLLFTLNFIKLWKQLLAGSKKVNVMSLLATSSLVFQFFALAFYFYSKDATWVFVTQIYMILSMLYIKFIHKKD